MRKYVVLLLVTVVVGVALGRIGRMQREAPPPAALSPALPDTTLTLSVTEDGIEPAALAVPVGTRVRLHISCRGSRTRRLSLGGYEQQVSLAIAPGVTGEAVFTADRPGDDFAWLLDGQPVARLRVSGSHLVEGHR